MPGDLLMHCPHTIAHKKRSQMKIGESVAVLAIFFLLLVIGIAFYSRIQGVSTGQNIQENNNMRAIKLVQNLVFMPELQCTIDNTRVDDCIDVEKFRAMKKVLNATLIPPYYTETLAYSTIRLHKLYPDTKVYACDAALPRPNPDSCYVTQTAYSPEHEFSYDTMYDHKYEQCDVSGNCVALSSTISTNVPVTLYDPAADSYGFGYLEVLYYPPQRQ